MKQKKNGYQRWLLISKIRVCGIFSICRWHFSSGREFPGLQQYRSELLSPVWRLISEFQLSSEDFVLMGHLCQSVCMCSERWGILSWLTSLWWAAVDNITLCICVLSLQVTVSLKWGEPPGEAFLLHSSHTSSQTSMHETTCYSTTEVFTNPLAVQVFQKKKQIDWKNE